MQIVVDGILTNYQILGTSEKTIVILHGWKSDLNQWLPIANNLAKDFKVVILDLPGMGATPRPTKTFDTYDYADFVKKFLQKIGVEKCVLIGHSFGGRLATILATSPLVEKLILVDSAGIENTNLYKKYFVKTYQAIFKPIVNIIVPQKIMNRIKGSIGSYDYKQAEKMRDIFVKVVNQDLTHLISKITCPTLVIWGDKDDILPAGYTKIYKKLLPHCQVKIVWGAKHRPHVENESEFLKIVQEFLC